MATPGSESQSDFLAGWIDEALNSIDAAQVSPTTPQLLPPNDLILAFTYRFRKAIQENDVLDIEDTNEAYKNAYKSNPDFVLYDCSALCNARKTAMNLLNSHNAMLTPLPSSESQSTFRYLIEKFFQLLGKLVDRPFDLLSLIVEKFFQLLQFLLGKLFDLAEKLVALVWNIVSEALKSMPDQFKDIVKHVSSSFMFKNGKYAA